MHKDMRPIQERTVGYCAGLSPLHHHYTPAEQTKQDAFSRVVNSFSTRLLSSFTDEYAHTYDISTYWAGSDRVS